MLVNRLRNLVILTLFLIIFTVVLSDSRVQSNQFPPSDGPEILWTHLSTTTGDLPTPGGSTQQTASLIVDIDKDGLNDFVIGSRAAPGPSLVWYQRTASGWQVHPIDSDVLDIEAGGAYHDIDQDGDFDIVMGGDYRSNKLWWWENPYPNFAPDQDWTRREVKTTGANKHHDQMFGDFDADGQSELVFWNQFARTLFLAEIPAEPRNAGPWPLTTLYRWDGGLEHEGLAQADMDGDGILDIIGGGRWFKYNGNASFTAHVIDDEQRFTRAAAGQLIAGGRPEVVFVAGDGVGPLQWYEWDGSAWIGHGLLDADVNHGHSLDVVDINQDGHLDIFVAEMRLDGGNPQSNMLFFWGDGAGNFVQSDVVRGYGNHESRVGDLDGDGDLDILGKPYNWETPRLDIWLNVSSETAATGQWCRHIVDENRPWRALFVTTADIDGDARADIITGGWWYKNPGAAGGPWVRNVIGAPLHNFSAVHDFDGDGDVDILGTSGQGAESSNTFVWARNDGTGSFTILDTIEPAQGDFLQGVAVAHLQADDDLAVALSWHAANQGVQTLTVPADPSTQTWIWNQLSPAAQDEALSAGDIDGDSDIDLLLGTQWLRNDQSTWRVFSLFQSEESPDRNRLADINGDGRLDAVVGYEAISVSGQLAWYEQPETPTSLWTEHPIANVIGPMSLDAVDTDQDGDIDVIVGEHNMDNPASAKLYVFENADGLGGDWVEHVVYTGDEHHDGAHVTDIDNDADYDIVSIGWSHSQVVLYEYTTAACDSPAQTPTPLPHPSSTASPTLSSTRQPTTTAATSISAAATDEPTSTPTSPATAQSSPLATPTEALPRNSCTVDGLQALYTFQEASGSVVHDMAGHDEPLDLTMASAGVSWLPHGGLAVNAASRIVSREPATRLSEAIKTTSELSVEVWLRPATLTQEGPARIVTVSASPWVRNFTLAQGKFGDHPTDVFDVRLRTTDASNNENGEPSLTTASGTAKSMLTHLVYTRGASGDVRIYVNGVEIARSTVAGDLTNWDTNHYLALANEIGGERPWLGELHRVALYNCAVGAPDVARHFAAGPTAE